MLRRGNVCIRTQAGRGVVSFAVLHNGPHDVVG
jgi:hypothetical protein